MPKYKYNIMLLYPKNEFTIPCLSFCGKTVAISLILEVDHNIFDAYLRLDWLE